MRLGFIFAMLCSAALGSPAGAACYSVYDIHQKLVYRNHETPVNLGRHLGDTVSEKFGPGAAMVITPSAEDCLPVAGAT